MLLAAVEPACCHPFSSLGGRGWGRQAEPRPFWGLGLACLTIQGGAADVAACSGNPRQATVPGKLLPQGEVCPWPPARPAQLFQRPEEAPGWLTNCGVSGISGSSEPATAPAVLASSPHASCHGTDCVLSADSDSTLQADLWSEVERGAGGLHTPWAREESPWSLLDCCWLLAFQDLPLIYPQIKSELSVFLCQRECFPTPGTSAVFLAQTVTAYFVS